MHVTVSLRVNTHLFFDNLPVPYDEDNGQDYQGNQNASKETEDSLHCLV